MKTHLYIFQANIQIMKLIETSAVLYFDTSDSVDLIGMLCACCNVIKYLILFAWHY